MSYLLGVVFGIAIRSGSPLSLNIAEPMWKQLAGMSLSIADLTEVDKDFVPGKTISQYSQMIFSFLRFLHVVWQTAFTV